MKSHSPLHGARVVVLHIALAVLGFAASASRLAASEAPVGRGAGSAASLTDGSAADSLFALPFVWEEDDGTMVRLEHWAGRPLLIAMECTDTCSYTMFRLQQLARDAARRGEDIDIVVVGYNPKVDDARAWSRFRRRRGLGDPHWHFLAGSDSATHALAQFLGLHYWFMDEHVLHEFGITLIDPSGRVRRALGWANRNEDLLVARDSAWP